MAKRRRDYKAEYQARQARSRAKYGVSYNKQRTLIRKAKERDVTPAQVRRALTTAKAAKDDPSSRPHGFPATTVGPAITPSDTPPSDSGGAPTDLAADIRDALQTGTMTWGDVLDFAEDQGYEHEDFYYH